MKLNEKQEKYAQLRAKGMEPSESFRQVWTWENMSGNTINKEAYKREQNKGIAARIAELKEIAMESVSEEIKVTVESLLIELEEAKKFAKECENPSAYTQAIMGKAKITGLDKRVIEIQAQEELTPWGSISSGIDEDES